MRIYYKQSKSKGKIDKIYIHYINNIFQRDIKFFVKVFVFYSVNFLIFLI